MIQQRLIINRGSPNLILINYYMFVIQIYCMITKLIPYFLFLFALPCMSQNLALTGVVKDLNNQPIAFANVTLYKATDNTFVNGTTTDELGAFRIEANSIDDYTIKISFLGFSAYEKIYKINKSIDLGTIILSEKKEVLDGVVVVAKKPTVKRLVDRLVFNVENSTLSDNNVLDVLKHTPGVLVNNGSITIKKSKPIIYINDRKVHLSPSEVQQLLEGTSASNIKSIEVITNPPAKYEAEGGSVLNIVTSKNIIAGYNGSVFGNYKQGSEFPKYSFGTSHFLKGKKINTYINYNLSPRKDYRHNDEFLNFKDNTIITSSWETDSERISESENQNINANIDYELNKNNTLGFTTNMLISPRDNSKKRVNSITEVFNSTHMLDSIFNTSNKSVDETFNLAFTLDYIHKFKRTGENLSISAHYTNYDNSNFQDVNTGYFLPNNDIAFRINKFQTFSSQEIKLYTGQIDYELPINDSEQFEAGGKLSNINSENILTQYVFDNDVKMEDLQNSDTFLYDETNYAIYTSYAKDWENWSLKSGLRVEYTNIEGTSFSTNQINNNDYFKFFPSLYLQNRLNENNELYFNYNKRIYRPRYAQLNPFKFFLNDNAYVTGDPNLKPQIDDVFTLGYTFNKNHTFELYYRIETDPASQITFQDNDDNLLKYINTNLDKSISYGLDFTTYSKIANNWNLYVLSSFYYYEENFFALESNNELLANDRWSTYAQVINYFTFLKDKSLTADISFLYLSPYIMGPTDISSSSKLDINIKKTFWNNRGALSIGVLDVFNSKNVNFSTKYLNQDVFFKLQEENRLFTMSFSYKFGNFRLSNNEKTLDLNERDRLKAN